jgi:mono/diheme cytochrome c family protein
LHALWTLDGLDAIDSSQVARALADKSPEVRASAIRLSERWLANPDDRLRTMVVKSIDDVSWTVRRQLSASIGELPLAARTRMATTMLERYGSDQVVVDATLSGLSGSEADVLDQILQPTAALKEFDVVTMLAATIARSGEVGSIERLVARAAGDSSIDVSRLALLRGIDMGLTAPLERGRGAGANAWRIAIAREPTPLTRVAGDGGEAGQIARSIASKLEWPGKPAPVALVAPLTDDEQRRFAAGAQLYKDICLGCHQADGHGREKLAPDLVDSQYVTAADPGAATRILLGGKEGQIGLMPPLGAALTDEQIAALLTYVRREWGHTASAVASDEVREIRGLTRTRTRPWTDVELQQGGRAR